MNLDQIKEKWEHIHLNEKEIDWLIEKVEQTNIIKYLNEYFGTESNNVQGFKDDFKEEYFPNVQTENLLNFLFWLERKSQ